MVGNIKILITAVLLLVVGFSGVCAEKNKIALFDLKNVVGGKSADGELFATLLFAELSRFDTVTMVERKELEKVMRERRLNRSGLANKRGYLEIAALVNADYIVTGRIYRDEEENELVINLKLTKVSDGKISGKCLSGALPKYGKIDKLVEKQAAKAAKYVVTFIKKKIKSNRTGAILGRPPERNPGCPCGDEQPSTAEA